MSTGLQLPGADTVFIEIVGIGLVNVEGVVGVVLPASAEIYHVVDTSNLVVARECQAEGVVFAIACIGHMYFAQYGRIECAWSTETVDA